MADTDTKALQAKEKSEMSTRVEQTRPGRVFTPAVDIFETDQALSLMADMPGVKVDDLIIDLRENVLTLSGEIEPPEGPDEVDVFREYHMGKYYRQFTLSEVIDQSKIDAELKNGVLRLTLPKVEKAAPRKIEVRAS